MPQPSNAPASRRRSRRPDERGATMVEMAIVLPLFLLLIFGIMEVSWYFAQNNEIRNFVGEAANSASIRSDDDEAVVAGPCSQLTLINSGELEYQLSGSTAGLGTGMVGTITASAPYHTLTGFLDGLFDAKLLAASRVFYVDLYDDEIPGWSADGGTKLCAA